MNYSPQHFSGYAALPSTSIPIPTTPVGGDLDSKLNSILMFLGGLSVLKRGESGKSVIDAPQFPFDYERNPTFGYTGRLVRDMGETMPVSAPAPGRNKS